MFSSIDIKPSTAEIKTGFSKVKEYILTLYADWLNFKVKNLYFFLGYRMRIKIISGKPGV